MVFITVKCLQRGTDWLLIQSRLRLVFQREIKSLQGLLHRIGYKGMWKEPIRACSRMQLWRERKTTGLNETILSGMKTICLVLKKKFLEMFRIKGLVKLFSFVNITLQHSTPTYYKLHSIHLWKWLKSSPSNDSFLAFRKRTFGFAGPLDYPTLSNICFNVFYCRLMHKRIVFKEVLKFTLKLK